MKEPATVASALTTRPTQAAVLPPREEETPPAVTWPRPGADNGQRALVGNAAAVRMADGLLAESRTLVLAPHADDETFACGGTIAKAKALGGEVFAGFTACRPHLREAKPFVGAVLSADQPQVCWSPETFKPSLCAGRSRTRSTPGSP